MKLRNLALVLVFSVGTVAFITLGASASVPGLGRNMVTFMRGPQVMEFFSRHRVAWGRQSAIHVAHAKAHDVLQLEPFEDHAKTDAEFDREMVELTKKGVKNGPIMEAYGPYISQSILQLYRAIDWTHIHHETTYDILSAKAIPWDKKAEWTKKTADYYLKHFDIPRSPAPLDVTMRRAGVMMKPYFTYFRNYYLKMATYFFVAHWWHPAIYEAMMIGGNDEEQDQAVQATDALTVSKAFQDRPQRMILSREMMPRYARMSPESANYFDNLHMLHGIAYDILAYPNWSLEEKEKELERVIRAMSYQPGDEKLARKFSEPYPNVDPRNYEPWMKSPEGEMSRIMMEMLDEMLPMMMPGLSAPLREKVVAQAKMKMTPGIQEGEIEGSFHDALMKLYPQMKMMPGTMEPGESNPIMMQMMMKGWLEKHGHMPDIPAYPMTSEPSLTQAGSGGRS